MSTKAYNLILLLIFNVGVVSAQYSQKGYVKTRGRLSESGELIPGKRLSETSISVKDGNTVLSDSKGDFEIALTTDEYSISDVKKRGYELIDKDVLLNKYKYSTNPIVLVLDTPDNIWEDRLAVERKVRASLNTQLKACQAEIKRRKEENEITAEEYRQELQKIFDYQSKNERLISDMVERYSTMDFDALDELNLRISHCIINGRLVEADSLLQTKGSIHSREQELRKLQEVNMQEENRLKARQEWLEKSKVVLERNLEDLSAYYIKFRVEQNVENQSRELAEYISKYNISNAEALLILDKSLQLVRAEENYPKELIAQIYYDMGYVYCSLEDYNRTLEYLDKALILYGQLLDEHHPTIVSVKQKIADVKSKQTNK